MWRIMKGEEGEGPGDEGVGGPSDGECDRDSFRVFGRSFVSSSFRWASLSTLLL